MDLDAVVWFAAFVGGAAGFVAGFLTAVVIGGPR